MVCFVLFVRPIMTVKTSKHHYGRSFSLENILRFHQQSSLWLDIHSIPCESAHEAKIPLPKHHVQVFEKNATLPHCCLCP